MNKQDLIEKYKNLEGVWNANGAEIARQCFLRDLEQLNEINTKKVTVPQFVADWYEENKDNLEINIFNYVYIMNDNENSTFKKWFVDSVTKPFQTLVNMHQFGYTVEVEKEKRYYVRFKGMESDDFNYLNFIKFQHAWVLSSIKLDKKFRTEHTKKQLEEAGFDWVFDCPGVEVEEVEG